MRKKIKQILNFILNDKTYIMHIIINIFMVLFDLCFLIPEAILLLLHINVACFNYKEKKRRDTERILSSQTIETSLISGYD